MLPVLHRQASPGEMLAGRDRRAQPSSTDTLVRGVVGQASEMLGLLTSPADAKIVADGHHFICADPAPSSRRWLARAAMHAHRPSKAVKTPEMPSRAYSVIARRRSDQTYGRQDQHFLRVFTASIPELRYFQV